MLICLKSAHKPLGRQMAAEHNDGADALRFAIGAAIKRHLNKRQQGDQ